MGVTIEAAAPSGFEHRMCAVLLRRWLSETHTPVPLGSLELAIGPLRVSGEIVHVSPTGAHGFGPIRLETDGSSGGAEPAAEVLARAIAAEVRRRAGTRIGDSEAPALPDVLARASRVPDRDLDPPAGHGRAEPVQRLLAQPADGRPRLLRTITHRAAADRWLSEHLDETVLPALRQDGFSAASGFPWLTRGLLAAAGLFGRHGVADEGELLATLGERLHEIAASPAEPPAVREVVSSWLTRRTLTDVSVLNGPALRYRRDLDSLRPITVEPSHHEVPNPLAPIPGEVAGPPPPRLGSGWSLRPVELDASGGGPDAERVHAWMHAPHVARTWHQAWSPAAWRAELATQLGGDHSLPCVVGVEGRDVGYVEIYRVLRDTLAATYPHDPHDLGVHIALGELDMIGRGAGSALLGDIARGLLAADANCVRVVAEPDVHNAASVGAFAKAGFVRDREVGLPSKNSALMVFPR